jgi:hypothetical protein
MLTKYNSSQDVIERLKKLPAYEYYRLIVDGRFLEKEDGWLGYAKREDNSLRHALIALRVALSFIHQSPNSLIICEIHSKATYKTGQLNPTTSPGKFRYSEISYSLIKNNELSAGNLSKKGLNELHGKITLNSENNACIAIIEERIQANNIDSFNEQLLALNNIKIENLDTFWNEILDKDLLLYYRAPKPTLIRTLLEKYLDEYNRNINLLKDNDEILSEIAKLIQNIEQLHPFADGNCRTCYILLQYLLIKNGFMPTMLYNPNQFDGYSIEELVSEIKTGIEYTEELINNSQSNIYNYTTKKNYQEISVENQKFINNVIEEENILALFVKNNLSFPPDYISPIDSINRKADKLLINIDEILSNKKPIEIFFDLIKNNSSILYSTRCLFTIEDLISCRLKTDCNNPIATLCLIYLSVYQRKDLNFFHAAFSNIKNSHFVQNTTGITTVKQFLAAINEINNLSLTEYTYLKSELDQLLKLTESFESDKIDLNNETFIPTINSIAEEKINLIKKNENYQENLLHIEANKRNFLNNSILITQGTQENHFIFYTVNIEKKNIDYAYPSVDKFFIQQSEHLEITPEGGTKLYRVYHLEEYNNDEKKRFLSTFFTKEEIETLLKPPKLEMKKTLEAIDPINVARPDTILENKTSRAFDEKKDTRDLSPSIQQPKASEIPQVSRSSSPAASSDVPLGVSEFFSRKTSVQSLSQASVAPPKKETIKPPAPQKNPHNIDNLNIAKKNTGEKFPIDAYNNLISTGFSDDDLLTIKNPWTLHHMLENSQVIKNMIDDLQDPELKKQKREELSSSEPAQLIDSLEAYNTKNELNNDGTSISP